MSSSTQSLSAIVDYLERVSASSYSCEFRVVGMSLAGAEIDSLKGNRFWSGYVEVLTEYARAKKGAPEPALVGSCVYKGGVFAFESWDRRQGAPIHQVNYWDGETCVEMKPGHHTSLRAKPALSAVPCLPWTVLQFGSRQLAPMITTVSQDGKAPAVIRNESSGRMTVEFAVPYRKERVKGMPCTMVVTVSRDQHGRILPWEVGVMRNGKRLAWCTVREHHLGDGVMLPSRWERRTLMSDVRQDGDFWFVYEVEADYSRQGPDPASVLALAAKQARIATRRGSLYSYAGVDQAMADVVANVRADSSDGQSKSASLRDGGMHSSSALRKPLGESSFPDIAAWVDQCVVQSLLKRGGRLDDSHCLQIACTFCAKWSGKDAHLQEVLAKHPGKTISLRDGVSLLGEFGLRYEPVEISKVLLKKAEWPIVVISEAGPGGRSHAGATAHARVVFPVRRQLMCWTPSEGLMKVVGGLDEGARSRALVDHRDLARMQ